MNENRTTMNQNWVDPDDAPDLSAPEWQIKFDAVSVKRGRPPLEQPKISTTIRLDADILERFRASGKGWQSRMNSVLREWTSNNP